MLSLAYQSLRLSSTTPYCAESWGRRAPPSTGYAPGICKARYSVIDLLMHITTQSVCQAGFRSLQDIRHGERPAYDTHEIKS